MTMQETTDLCLEHSRKIEDIIEKNHENEKTMIQIQGDVKHIRERLDNGISKTLYSLRDDFNEFRLFIANEVKPAIDDSKFWVGMIKKTTARLAGLGVLGGLITFLFWIIKKEG